VLSEFNDQTFRLREKFSAQADPNEFYFRLRDKKVFKYGEGGCLFRRIVYFRNVVFLQHLVRIEENLIKRMKSSETVRNNILLAMKVRRQFNEIQGLINEQAAWLTPEIAGKAKDYKKVETRYATRRKLNKFDSLMSGYCTKLHKELKKSRLLPNLSYF
jgi:hypothetical protein